jgi:maleate isomerase
MYKPGNVITSLKREVEFDKGRHHRARLGFILMSTDLAAEADFYDMDTWPTRLPGFSPIPNLT